MMAFVLFTVAVLVLVTAFCLGAWLLLGALIAVPPLLLILALAHRKGGPHP